MTITKALRKLYKVIVGEEAPANANTITKVLLALAEAWTGSGGGSGGGGDPGYSCKTIRHTLFNGNVTTIANKPNESEEPPHGVYANATVPIDETIKADSIVVIFEGVEYTCVNDGSHSYYTYGAPYNDDEDIFDWSNFPFNVTNLEGPGEATFHFATENAGTYTVKIETVEDTVEITPCFEKAVNAAIGDIH